MNSLASVTHFFDDQMKGTPPSKVVFYTTVSLVALQALYHLPRFSWDGRILQDRAFRWLQSTPFVGSKIMDKMVETGEKLEREIEDDVPFDPEADSNCGVLPEKGLSDSKIQAMLQRLQKLGKRRPEDGTTSGTQYTLTLPKIQQMAHTMFLLANPLHPDSFPGVIQMESLVVKMALKLFHAAEDSLGLVTSGGTQSIDYACRCYKAVGKQRGIDRPNMVLPSTAHAAFEKAARSMGIEVRSVPVNEETYKADIPSMVAQMDGNTIMCVGSTPSFGPLIMDPIEELAEVCLNKKVPLHVDNCLGSFFTPFAKELGAQVPPFDFQLPGVFSMSVDPHKYGLSEKGCSLFLMRSVKQLRALVGENSCIDWPGGMYAMPTIAGSRPGGPIAGTFAALLHHGKRGYVEATRSIRGVVKAFQKVVEDEFSEDLNIMGKPKLMGFAMRSSTLNIYDLHSEMGKRGWAFSSLQKPPAVHMCFTRVHGKKFAEGGYVERFRKDLKDSVDACKTCETPGQSGEAKIYGANVGFDRLGILDLITLYYHRIYRFGKNKDVREVLEKMKVELV